MSTTSTMNNDLQERYELNATMALMRRERARDAYRQASADYSDAVAWGWIDVLLKRYRAMREAERDLRNVERWTSWVG